MRIQFANFLLMLLAFWPIMPAKTRTLYVYAPVTRDPSTLQHLMEIQLHTPLQKLRVALDLSGDLLWTACASLQPQSSTYKSVKCHTPLCTASGSALFGCGTCPLLSSIASCKNDTCKEILVNPATGDEIFDGVLSEDVLALPTNDGIRNLAGKLQRFVFGCAPRSLLKGLAETANGTAGLNWSPLALPFQITVGLELERKFGVCLSSSATDPGVLFFGSPPAQHYASNVRLNYTFLDIPHYPRAFFLKVTAVAVNEKKLKLENPDSLRVGIIGNSGTRLSAVEPYGRVTRTVYTVLREAFLREATAVRMVRVQAVAPFDLCFDARSVGPAVPVVDLVLDNEFVVWKIYGSNSMVKVSDKAMCFAFLESADAGGGAAIVLGSHQLLDNLVVFDLIEFKLHFTSSLLRFNSSCSSLHANIAYSS